MTRSRHRWWLGLIFAASAAALAALGGCAGCGAECPETPCPGEMVCETGTCVKPSTGCGGCAPGQSCEGGECVWDDPQCDGAGEPCNPSGPLSDGFLCVPWTGDRNEAVCADICGPETSCGEGAACVLLQTLNDSSCNSSDDCPEDKTCSSGRCRFAACRPSECSGFLEGDEVCNQKYGDNQRQYPNGAKCYPIRSGANYCLPAGTKETGESCTAVEQAIQAQDYTDTCAAGFACADGTCVKACTSADACSGDKECVGVDSATIREGIGQCATTCTPFTEGECGEGQTCKPIAEGTGRCVDAGDKSAYAVCEPGANECEKGLACITHQAAEPRLDIERIARCHPICDTSVGETNEEGELPEEAQNKRDATCPQPEPVAAAYRVVHVAGGAETVDVYRAGESMPVVSGLGPGETNGDGPEDYLTVETGEHDYSALPEGAPPTDLPLAEWTERLASGEGRIFVLAAPDPEGDAELRAVSFPAPVESTASDSEAAVRIAHTIPDMEAVDVVAVPVDEMPGGDSEILLAEELETDGVGDLKTLSSATYDIYVFEAGADRTSADAVLSYDAITLDGMSTLHLRGTLVPDDAYPNYPMLAVDAAPKPNQRPDTPPTTCVENADRPFGYCQQICTGGADDYGTDVCDGDSMGCRPTLDREAQEWDHLCGPVGGAEVGESCNPFAPIGDCAEGNYCLEYGNTREGHQSGGDRGVCHSLCAIDGEGAASLGCAGSEACKPLAYRGDFGVGECGIPCEPTEDYTAAESNCPAGLESCRPVASLQYDSSGQGNTPPVVREEQAFCSSSGDIEPGEVCQAADCRPKAECMFPRSEQRSLLNSLLSPYVGSSGQTPSCKLRCDPFDGDDSAATCGEGETCLFNYPWSAEVGHCATIASQKAPGDPCDTPGLACGEDSICADRGQQSICMRFCDYEGPDVEGKLRQSTCPSGYKCAPFTRDVGVCEK